MIHLIIVLGFSALSYHYGWLKGYEDQKVLDEDLPFAMKERVK